MTDESIPTRVWTVGVHKDQVGTVTVRESDLDIPEGATFADIQTRAIVAAQDRARADDRVDWTRTDVFYQTDRLTWT